MSDTQNKMPEFTAEEIAKWSVGWSSETLQDKIDAVAFEIEGFDRDTTRYYDEIEMCKNLIEKTKVLRLNSAREMVWLMLQRKAEIDAELEKFSWGPF